MRGKGGILGRLRLTGGITPAHAGKSISKRIDPVKRWDHPRTCGEKILEDYANETTMGSPPHMRGKAQGMKLKYISTGITPAHAGKRRKKGD